MPKLLLFLLGLALLGYSLAGVRANPASAEGEDRAWAVSPTPHPALRSKRDFPLSDSFLPPIPGPVGARLPILEYHSTEFKMSAAVQMKTEWFLAQMDWLAQNHFRSLDGDELLLFVQGERRAPRRSFVLRFDLGLPEAPDFREAVLPALEKHGFTAIFFLLPSAVQDECGGDFFCWSELRRWERAGLIEVGSHGISHPDYQEIPVQEQAWDARESKRIIEAKLGHPIRFFAFPYDSVPEDPAGLLRPLGYLLGFAGPRGERSVLFEDPDPFALPAYYPYSGEKKYRSSSAPPG
jgi:peptidoglycan/xylan/chitin deacetylase (PgdA/CDA1 family)